MSGHGKTDSEMPEGEEVERQVKAFYQASGSRQRPTYVFIMLSLEQNASVLLIPVSQIMSLACKQTVITVVCYCHPRAIARHIHVCGINGDITLSINLWHCTINKHYRCMSFVNTWVLNPWGYVYQTLGILHTCRSFIFRSMLMSPHPHPQDN